MKWACYSGFLAPAILESSQLQKKHISMNWVFSIHTTQALNPPPPSKKKACFNELGFFQWLCLFHATLAGSTAQDELVQ